MAMIPAVDQDGFIMEHDVLCPKAMDQSPAPYALLC